MDHRRGQNREAAAAIATTQVDPQTTISTDGESTGASGSRHRRQRRLGKRTRGYSRYLEVDRYVSKHGRIKIDVDGEIGRPVDPNAPKFSNCIGTAVRETIPIHFPSWKSVPEEVREKVIDRVLEYYDFDISSDAMKNFLNKTMRDTFREFRWEMHSYYCEFDDIAEARETPLDRLTDPVHWNILCDRWESPSWEERTRKAKEDRAKLLYNHQAGSKSFPQLQHELKKKRELMLTRWSCSTRLIGTQIKGG